MDQILKNILRPVDQKRSGAVVRPLGNNMYQIIDAQGRRVDASSDVIWAPGTSVTVKSGVVIGRSDTTRTQKIYKV